VTPKLSGATLVGEVVGFNIFYSALYLLKAFVSALFPNSYLIAVVDLPFNFLSLPPAILQS
jgi:hypothetical protein